jgi:hypothetical protein
MVHISPPGSFLAGLVATRHRLHLPGLQPILSTMEEKSEATKSILWDIYMSIGYKELGHVGVLVGTVEAASEHEAIEKAPARIKQLGRKLMAVRVSSRGFPASLEGK